MSTDNLNDTTPQQDDLAGDSASQQANKRRRRRRRSKLNGLAPSIQAQAADQQSAGTDVVEQDFTGGAPNGQAQSQTGEGGGRRRKRNRRKKNKQAAQTQQPEQQARPPVERQERPARQERQDRQDRQPNFNGGSGQFSRGNGNGGGGMRRNRQRRGGGGSSAFVGPMDHVYRGGDNMADSTVGMNGNYRHPGRNSQPNINANGNIASYAESVTVPVRDDAPTRIFCFIDDLFFHAKIRETSRLVGIKVEFIKNEKEQIERLLEVAETSPILVIVDLNNLAAKPIALVKKLRPKLKRGSSLIGFVSHIQGELKVEAMEAGCDVVMPRSAFSSNLANILRRYVDEDENEPNFNTDAAPGY